MKALLAAAFFALLGGFLRPATAAEYTIKHVETMISEPGADKIAFMTEVAHKLRAFSDRTGFEACAAIATDGDKFGVVITTSESHVGCAIDNSNVPVGMHNTGETIHSHGNDTHAYANAQDKVFMGIYNTRRNIKLPGQWTDRFSPVDYSRSGYLAGVNGLYFQSGVGTARIVVKYQ